MFRVLCFWAWDGLEIGLQIIAIVLLLIFELFLYRLLIASLKGVW